VRAADATGEALRRLAEVVYDGRLPHGIAPAVVLSNWNERPERTQGDVLSAFDEAIGRVEAALGEAGGRMMT
jgi:hypothetical protein